MGANIGTTITNTLVSLGHITRSDEFRRAFAGATVHDFFNLITVSFVFPIEIVFHPLERPATWMAQHMTPGVGGKMPNPLKDAVKWLAKHVQHALETVGLNGGWLALVMFAIALVTIIVALYFITKNMRLLMADRIEVMMNVCLERAPC